MSTPEITKENVNQLLERYVTVAWQANVKANIKDGATLKKWFQFLASDSNEQVIEGETVLTNGIVYDSIFNFLDKSPKTCFNLVDATFIDRIRTFVIENFLKAPKVEEQTEKIVEL